MTEPKHQHTVPKFYLEGFTDDNGVIWVYDLMNQSLRPQTPKNTAVRTKYYTGTDEQGRSILEFDDLLSTIEGQTKPIIDKLANREELTDEEYTIFSYFLGYMMVRVPVWKGKMEAMFIEETKKVLALMYGTLDASEKTLKMHESATKTKSKIDAKTMHEFYKSGEWELKPSKNFTLGTMADVGRSLAQPFYNLEWKILHAAKKGHFLTSDNPLSILSSHDFDSDARPQGGILEPQVYKFMPLNKKACLHIGYEQNFSISHEIISRKLMRIVNSTVVQNSERFLYSHDPRLIKFLLLHTKIIDFRNEFQKVKKRESKSD